jgi:hypothetical protein
MFVMIGTLWGAGTALPIDSLSTAIGLVPVSA